MKTFSFILFLLSITSCSVFTKTTAQNHGLTGTVQVIIDSDTLVPSEIILVSLEGTGISTILGVNGKFSFSNIKQGEYHLKISGFGYNEIDTVITFQDRVSEEVDIYLSLTDACEVGRKLVEKDIIENNPTLFLVGGIVPVVCANQRIFEEKYHIKYQDYGDVSPHLDCIAVYNKSIFEYLDNKFGSQWRNEVRKDVVGLN